MFCLPISISLSFCLSHAIVFLILVSFCLCLSLSVCLSTGGYVSTDYNASYVERNRAYNYFTCPEDDNTLFNCTYEIVDSCDGNEAIIVCLSGK